MMNRCFYALDWLIGILILALIFSMAGPRRLVKKSPVSSEIFHLNFALSQDKNFTNPFPVV